MTSRHELEPRSITATLVAGAPGAPEARVERQLMVGRGASSSKVQRRLIAARSQGAHARDSRTLTGPTESPPEASRSWVRPRSAAPYRQVPAPRSWAWCRLRVVLPFARRLRPASAATGDACLRA